MVNQEQLKEQIYRYVDAPLNPGVNFDTGLYYEAIGQTAAALSFFFIPRFIDGEINAPNILSGNVNVWFMLFYYFV